MKLFWPLHVKIIPDSPWAVAMIDGEIKVFCTNCSDSIELERARKIPAWNCRCTETIITAPLNEDSLAGPIAILKRDASIAAFEEYPGTLEEAEEAAEAMLTKYGEAKAQLIQQFRLLHELERLKDMS
jgi:hypothetical protein